MGNTHSTALLRNVKFYEIWVNVFHYVNLDIEVLGDVQIPRDYKQARAWVHGGLRASMYGWPSVADWG